MPEIHNDVRALDAFQLGVSPAECCFFLLGREVSASIRELCNCLLHILDGGTHHRGVDFARSRGANERRVGDLHQQAARQVDEERHQPYVAHLLHGQAQGCKVHELSSLRVSVMVYLRC